MKVYAIITVIITAIGIGALCLILKAWKGVRIRYGAAGMVLLLMPHSLGILFFPDDSGYFIATLIGAVLGVFLFAGDIPKGDNQDQISGKSDRE